MTSVMNITETPKKSYSANISRFPCTYTYISKFSI